MENILDTIVKSVLIIMHRPNMNICDLIGFVILSPFQQIVGFFKCGYGKFCCYCSFEMVRRCLNM